MGCRTSILAEAVQPNRHTGYRIAGKASGGFCSWVLLARAPMLEKQVASQQYRILEQ
jgi:hypothetical protein